MNLNPKPNLKPNPNPMLMLQILFALSQGPRYLVKVGLADFGVFLVILLIQAKVNGANDYKPYPKRLPQGSIKKIQEFLRIFPILSVHQRDILALFIDDTDVEGFLCEHFGDDYQRIIDKYEPVFRWMLPRMLHHGLAISPLYKGRYACSCAKWVVINSIISIISTITPNVSQMIVGKQLSSKSADIAFAVSVLQEYGDNYVFNLYINTINEVERTHDTKWFALAEQEFNKSLVTHERDHEKWVELHERYKDKFRVPVELQTKSYEKDSYSFALHPQKWNFNLICWIMNEFENYDDLLLYIKEVTAD
jgi:hypothetical protein